MKTYAVSGTPKADVHRKGITFSSRELSQTPPNNKLQAMATMKKPAHDQVSASPTIKGCALFSPDPVRLDHVWG